MSRPRLLDLFCGAGGAAVGYSRAGFEVVGVDIAPQPRYPFEFHQADALEFLAAAGRDFDAIHASPPCQRYTTASFCRKNKDRHPDLVDQVRSLFKDMATPYVIENVMESPLCRGSIVLCGLMFGLKVFRHRVFECSEFLWVPPHPSHRGKRIGDDGMCCVVGHGGGTSRKMRAYLRSRHGCGGQQTKENWASAMGIDWMSRDELSQAIPPAYTEWIGKQLMTQITTVERISS
jgi:DNA (cytosine-5)-methyltransferase 1